MIQVIRRTPQERRPSFSEQIGQGVSRGVNAGLEHYGNLQQQKAQEMQMLQENEAAKGLGIDISGISDPKIRQQAVAQALQGKQQQEQYGRELAGSKELQEQKYGLESSLKSGDLELDKKRINTIRQHFGDKAAEIYSAAPEGGKTQIINSLLEARQRGLNIDELLTGSTQQKPIQQNKEIISNSKNPSTQKYDIGLTPKEKANRQKEYFKINEPKVIELADTQRKLQQEEARYNRLGEIFSDSSKIPSSFTAALFTKDGQLNDIVYSQMTPEAQEAVKLIIDSTSNIKDTYGARVTNFDLQTYLKKLPSLLNSPEGKQRVIRDLKVMNQLNQMHAQGIQEIFDESGGTDQIPFSTAERLYKERYGDQEKELLDKFVNPEKAVFKEMPEPNKYLGRKIKNPETGEIFISDGNEWKPFKG